MTPDGAPASGNPFEGSVVYTLGHRNPQGLAFAGNSLWLASPQGERLYRIPVLGPAGSAIRSRCWLNRIAQRLAVSCRHRLLNPQ